CSDSWSSSLQKCVKRIEAFETTPQNFFIGQSLLRPTLEDAIDSNAFAPLKFIVIEISIVNHFCDLLGSFVLDPESPDQRFKGAVVSIVREIAVQHVEREHTSVRRKFGFKNEFCLRID